MLSLPDQYSEDRLCVLVLDQYCLEMGKNSDHGFLDLHHVHQVDFGVLLHGSLVFELPNLLNHWFEEPDRCLTHV